MTQTEEQPPTQETIRRGYELPDVSVKGLLIFFVIFVVMGAAAHICAWFLTIHFLEQPRSVDVVISAAPPQQRFPEPNLQPSETHNQLDWQDMDDLRRQKNQIFQQLGWNIDPETGAARIPDDIVNQLAAQRAAKGATK
jgi:hypothetical protein